MMQHILRRRRRDISPGGGAGSITNVSAPVVQGNAREESLLYVTDGEWTNNPNQVSYQWKRNGSNISGATNGYYFLTAADVGQSISVEVTMTNTYDDTSASVSVSLSGTVVQSYAKDVLDLNPVAFWRLNDTSGTTADNFEGTAALDGSYNAQIVLDSAFFKDGSITAKSPGTSNSHINLYSATLNTVFNKNVGAISFWVRQVTATDWSLAAGGNPSMFRITVDSSNNFRCIRVGSGIWRFVRTVAGANKLVDVDLSDNPAGWVNFIITWDTSGGGEFKVYRNAVQQGTTQTSLPTMAGSLSSTGCTLLAADTSNTGSLPNLKICNFCIFDFVPDSSQRSVLANAPTGKWWHVDSTVWDFEALFPDEEGAPINSFLYDVDNDGELELVGSIGSRAYYAAIKSDGTVVWENDLNSTAVLPARTQQIRDGVLYVSHDKIRAIRLTDGQVLWENNSKPALMACGSEGVVVAASNQLNILSYSTGLSIGGSFPVTMPFSVSVQTLSVGDTDKDGRDEIVVGERLDNQGRMALFDHDGSLLWQRDDDQNHIDRFEIFDVDGDGNNEIVCVIDTDNSSGGTTEGDELVLLNSATGAIKDSYNASSHQVAYCLTEKVPGASMVYAFEFGSTLGMLDASMEEIWEVTGFSIQGALCGVVRVMGRWLVMTVGTSEIDPDQVYFEVDGTPARFFDGGNEWTYLIDGKGGFNVRVEARKQVGNHHDFFYVLGRNGRGDIDATDVKYHWNKFVLNDIP